MVLTAQPVIAAYWSPAVLVPRAFATRGDVFVVGTPFLGLKVWIEEVCGVEVGAINR